MKTTPLTFALVKLVLFLGGAVLALDHRAAAAPGDLDPTFGIGGKVITNFGGNSTDQGYSIAIQNDGKIVVAGTSNQTLPVKFALVRYNADGSLDTSFNSTGIVTTAIGSSASEGRSVALQSDQKIVVAGFSINGGNHDFALVRYNADGSLDTSFNGTGKVTTDFGGGEDTVASMAIQSDGKIVLVGSSVMPYSDIAVARYNTNGSLDTSFNGTGKVKTDFGFSQDSGTGVAIQIDGKIVVGGWSDYASGKRDFAVVRYNTNGSLDTSFNLTGKVTTAISSSADQANAIAIQSDGKIILAGGSTAFAVVRYNANGSLDSSFNGNGKVTTSFGSGGSNGWAVAVQPNGKIVVAGESLIQPVFSPDFTVARYNADGSLDNYFNGNGKVRTDFSNNSDIGYGVVLQSDGKIVVAGQTYNGFSWDFAVARYQSELDTDGDGIPDIYETGTGIYVSPTDTGTDPNKADTDGDLLTDGEEVNTYHTNPNIKDTDGDGFDDGFEVATGFSPTDPASTPDAQSSIRTAAEYRFNAAPGISYRIEASTDFTNWQMIETNIIGTGGVTTRFYSIDGQPRRFFRSRRN